MSDKTRCESKEAEFDRQFLEIIKPQMDAIEYLLKSRIAFIAVYYAVPLTIWMWNGSAWQVVGTERVLSDGDLVEWAEI